MLEIEGTPQERARDIVVVQTGVGEVAPHGARLHATVDNAAQCIPQIEAALQASDVADVRVEQIDPSLEDVFVALIASQSSA